MDRQDATTGVTRPEDDPRRIASPHGPSAVIDPDGVVRIEWGEADWFGPGHLVLPDSLTAGTDLGATVEVDPEHGQLVFRLVSHRDLTGLATTGSFDQPSVGWPVFHPTERLEGGIDPTARGLAFLGCEFALPTRARADLDGWTTLPGRPATAWPLLVRANDGRTLMLAPLDHFHEQIIGINGGTLRCGWHGDLDRVPAGFTTEMVLLAGSGPSECLETWGALLRDRAGTRRPGRRSDALTSRPSYWTDNGAAYWYRTEPGHDVAGSIVAAVDDLRDHGVVLGAVQLDSWFYPHVTIRPFDTDEWVVPPTPMVAWEERSDVLPDGIPALRRRLGDPPLVAHIRHLAATAPICDEVPVALDADGIHAMPTTPAAYERWLDQCVTWGVETFEHDWLVEAFHRSGWLREEPGRARDWQEGIDAAAGERGITLQWCMATPADMAQTITLGQVTSVRTSGDHGYIATPGQLWTWFCTTNALARALRLTPFKDVFRTDAEIAGTRGEPDALLSALSMGPVGVGDRVGRCDVDLIRRCCRADGLLVGPDVPVAATDESLLATRRGGPPDRSMSTLTASCWTDHPAGRWTYLVTMHTRSEGRSASATIPDDSPSGTSVLWDWRTRRATVLRPDDHLDIVLAHEDWAYHVLAPVLPGEIAVIGDVDLFATAGRERIEVDLSDDGSGVRVTLKGADELVTLTGWSRRAPTIAGHDLVWDADTGLWTCAIEIPPRGWASVTIIP